MNMDIVVFFVIAIVGSTFVVLGLNLFYFLVFFVMIMVLIFVVY